MKEAIILILFIIGLLFCCTQKHSDVIEHFDTASDCPNYLIQKGNEIHLLNKNKALIPGVNPVRFNNLEEYIEFLNWQRKMGIHCPVLYFQQTYDAQNNVKYRMLPDIIDKNAGFPSHVQAIERPLYDATHDDMPFNQKSFPGFDSQDQYIGVYTPLDKLYHSSDRVSASPMDQNWGGPDYSRDLVKGGAYKENTRPGLPLDYSRRDHEGRHHRHHRSNDLLNAGSGENKYYNDKYRENKEQYEKHQDREKHHEERHKKHHDEHHAKHEHHNHKKHEGDHHKKHHDNHKKHRRELNSSS